MKRDEPFNVLRDKNSWENSPRATAIVAVIAPQLSAAAAAAVAAGAAAPFAYTALVAAVNLGITLVTSWTVGALTPAPPSPKQSILVNARDGVAPEETVYGEVRKGGVITYLETTNNGRMLYQIITLAAHEIESIDTIYINDEVATLSDDSYDNGDRQGPGWVISPRKWSEDDDRTKHEIRILYHLGNQTSVTTPFANSSTFSLQDQFNEDNIDGSQGITPLDPNFIGRERAYLFVRMGFEADVFDQGLPIITVKMKGKRVYNPITQTTAYSNNAALCIRDYLTSDFGLADSEIDDTVFALAASDCDDDIALSGGGTEKRYAINGVVKANQSYGDVLNEMVTACAGTLFWGAGKWKLNVGVYTGPTKTLTLDDLRSSISLQTRINLRDQFNKVQGVFTDASNRYLAADYPPVVGQEFVAEDNGVEKALDLDLPFTTSSATAQRIATLTLLRGREQITFSAEFGLNAFDVEVGEVVALTIDRYGWVAKPFEVAGWRFGVGGEGDFRVTLSLRETSQEAFAWNEFDETAIISNNSNLLDRTEVASVSIPSDQIISEVRIIREKITEAIEITVTSADADSIDFAEVQYKAVGAVEWRNLGTGQLGIYELIDPEPGSYVFRARAVNVFGFTGAWATSSNVQTAGSAEPPSTVSGLFYEVNGGNTTLEWNAVTDLDLSFYRVRHAIETTGATWANSTTAIDKVPRPGSSLTLPSRAGTYLIKAYDKTGLASQDVDSVVVPSNEVPTYTNTLTQTDSPTFSGSKTGCSVNGANQLIITDPSSAPSEATYDFSTYIETSDSAARLVRARVDASVERIDNSAGLFDDLPGLFDDLPGLFDSFTGAAQFADTNLLFYISATPDDPAGTPTWSAYKQFRAGEFYGRAFRFRVVLKSTSDNITPAIGTLSAIVEYN